MNLMELIKDVDRLNKEINNLGLSGHTIYIVISRSAIFVDVIYSSKDIVNINLRYPKDVANALLHNPLEKSEKGYEYTLNINNEVYYITLSVKCPDGQF